MNSLKSIYTIPEYESEDSSMAKSAAKEKKLTKFWFIWNLVETLILLAGGVLAIVAGVQKGQSGAAGESNIESIVAYFIAGFVLLDGLLRIIMFLVRYDAQKDVTPLFVSGFEVASGVLMVLLEAQKQVFTFAVVNMVAIILMIAGSLLLTLAIFFIVKKKTTIFVPILEIIFAAILIGVGVLIEVLYNTSDQKEVLVLIMIGIIVSLAAIALFVTALINHSKAKKADAQAAQVEDPNLPVQADTPAPVEPQGPEVIDVEAADAKPEPEQLEGPRAIEHKDENED